MAASRVPGRGRSLCAQVLVGLVRCYRMLSRYGPPRCRFAPTCSEYALQALQGHGAVRGGWLSVRRIARCHPFNVGGVDRVPSATPPAAYVARSTVKGI